MAFRDIFSSSPSSSSTYPSRSNYSYGLYSPQPSRAFSPARHTPSYSQLTRKPSPAQSRMMPASDKSLLSGPISHPVSSWPTPPASEFARSSPPAEDYGSHEDQNGTLGTLKHGPPPPDDPPSLSKLTPAYFEEQLARREESLVLRDISPQQFREWEALHPTLQEADDVRYEYDSFASRMIVQCMPGPIHDSVQGYFIRRVAATMDRVAGDACDDLINVNSGTGKCMIRSIAQPPLTDRVRLQGFQRRLCVLYSQAAGRLRSNHRWLGFSNHCRRDGVGREL